MKARTPGGGRRSRRGRTERCLSEKISMTHLRLWFHGRTRGFSSPDATASTTPALHMLSMESVYLACQRSELRGRDGAGNDYRSAGYIEPPYVLSRSASPPVRRPGTWHSPPDHDETDRPGGGARGAASRGLRLRGRCSRCRFSVPHGTKLWDRVRDRSGGRVRHSCTNFEVGPSGTSRGSLYLAL